MRAAASAAGKKRPCARWGGRREGGGRWVKGDCKAEGGRGEGEGKEGGCG